MMSLTLCFLVALMVSTSLSFVQDRRAHSDPVEDHFPIPSDRRGTCHRFIIPNVEKILRKFSLLKISVTNLLF